MILVNHPICHVKAALRMRKGGFFVVILFDMAGQTII